MSDPTHAKAVLLITAGTIMAAVTLLSWILRAQERQPKSTTPPPPPSFTGNVDTYEAYQMRLIKAWKAQQPTKKAKPRRRAPAKKRGKR